MPHPKHYYMCLQILLNIRTEDQRLMGGIHGGLTILRGIWIFCSLRRLCPGKSETRLSSSLKQYTATGSGLSGICSAFLSIRTPKSYSGCFLPGPTLFLTRASLLEPSLWCWLRSCTDLLGFSPNSDVYPGEGPSLVGSLLGTWTVHPGCFYLDLERSLRATSCPVPDKVLGIDPEAVSNRMLAFCREHHSVAA